MSEKNDFLEEVKDVIDTSEEFLNEKVSEGTRDLKEIKSNLNDKLVQLKEKLEIYQTEVSDNAKKLAKKTRKKVKEKPYESIGIAIAIGFVIGLLTRKK